MKKSLSILILLILFSINVSALDLKYDFKVDGICYKIKGDSNSVEVTSERQIYSFFRVSYYKDISGKIVIPEKVEHDGKSYLVTEIGYRAFYGCTGLTSVTIPNSVTRIGYRAFYGCTGLTSVKLPNSVTSIGENAFDGTAWYENQPDGLIYLGKVAYKYKGEMPDGTAIVLKDRCTGISGSAFEGCTGLTSIAIPNSVTEIGSSAFYSCTGLTSVTIPSSVKVIDSNAFKGCTGLTSVGIPNTVTKIGNCAFEGCTGLTSVVIPNSVAEIGSSAFSCCTGLTSVAIPNSVTVIDSYTFSGCTGLTSVEIPNTVTKIGYRAFDGCTGLTSVAIPSSVTMIDSYAFSGCTGLTLVAIPNSVTEIDSYAFSGCTGLTSVEIPNTVTKIGERAFEGCTGLTSLYIPNSVTEIGSSVFYGCSGLMSIVVDPGASKYDSRNNCNALIETESNTLIAGCMNTIIPNSVTKISSSAFEGCTGLTSITIPDSVTEIGRSAFEGCTGLILLAIPNSVKTIDQQAFAGCTGLESIVCEIRDPQPVVVGEKNNSDVAASVFNGVDLSHCVLSVPQGTKDLYDNIFPWYAFDSISEHAGSTHFDTPTTDEENLHRYYENQQYVNVIQHGEQMLQNPDFASNPDNIDVIVQLAESYYYMNRYSKAMDCYEKVIAFYSSSIDENRLKIAEMHKNIGFCYFKLLEYDKAIESFKEALSRYEAENEVAYLQEMIGRCYLFNNEFDNAEEYYIKAINGYEKSNNYLSCYRCHVAIGQFDEAKECLLGIRNRQEIFSSVLSLGFLTQISNLDLFFTKPLIQKRYDFYFDNKMYDEAIDLCSQAQEADAFSLVSASPLLSISLQSKSFWELSEMKGRCYYAKQDIDSALIVFQQARMSMLLSEKMNFFSLFPLNRDLQSRLDEDIALCYISKGGYLSAYVYLKESVELRQESTIEYFGVNTTAERAEYWGSQSHLFQNTYPAVALEIYNQEDTTQVQREMLCDLYDKSALFSKGLLLTSENEFKNIILDSSNENVKRMFYRLQEINIRLNELKEQSSPEQNDVALHLEQEAKTIEKELMTISKEYRDFRGNLKITWDSVQAALSAGDIAIEFLSFPKLETEGTMYVALTVRPGYTHPHMTVLCDESELIEAAKQPYTNPELSRKIWGPLAQELEGVKNIYFSPCGELHKIGIESMPHWDGSGRLMNECGLNFYRLSSTRELAINRTPIESSGAALFGGIYYDAEKTDHEKLGARYKGHEEIYATRGFDFGNVDLRGISSTDYLSASLDEVKSIKAFFENKNDSVYYKIKDEATEASFKAIEGQKKRIIHIATHGFFLTDSAARAEKANHKNGRAWITDDAMTHSGLLFAAAAITVKYDEKVSESYEDGVLTAYEVSQLNLRGLDLVVLSACQTGNGEISGEGVFGMQRGFKMAGAQSIIMSLWNVGDEATKDMMTQFYKYYLDDNLSKREAFLKAQQYVKEKDNEYARYNTTYSKKRLSQPHWAAFILLDAI